MTEVQIKLRECPIGEPFSRMDCVIAPAVVEDLARHIGQQWIGSGAWMVCVKVEAYIIKSATTPAAESTNTPPPRIWPKPPTPTRTDHHDHAQKTSKSIRNATTSIAPHTKPSDSTRTTAPAMSGVKAHTAGEAIIALRRALPNVGDRVPMREIIETGSNGAGQAAWQSCYQMDGIRTPFAYRAPAARKGPDRFAHMERVRPDDEPGRSVQGSRGVLLVTQPTDNRPPTTAPALDRVAHIQQERAVRIAHEGTDEPIKGIQLSDGKKKPPPTPPKVRPDDDDDDPLPPGVGVGGADTSRVLQRLLQLMPRVGDSVLIADCWSEAAQRMTARQICRTDRRFKLCNAGQTAKRKEL